MSNTIKTNSLATLVALRMAESAGYLLVGSKKYFKNQLEDKRNGQTYRFVIRDTAEAVNSLEANPATQKTNIVEREVSLTLDPWHVMVDTNAIERVTDLNWDVEIAIPNSNELIKKMVKKVINKDLGKVGTAYIGAGFTPLSQGAAHLASITNEELYGFCDPNVEAILTSNGQMFVPVNAPDMYSKGLLGKFHGAEYRSQRFFPCVKVSKALADELTSATVDSIEVDGGDSSKMVLTLSGVTQQIKKGTPLFIDGVYATDFIGEPTSEQKVFVALEDTSAAGKVSIQAFDYSKNGTREVANEDGSQIVLSALSGASVTGPAEGKYYMAEIRANGVEEFETLDRLDAAGTDYEKQTVEGITVHQNRLVDIEKMTNKTRWDVVQLAGCVDGRGKCYCYIK